MVVKGILIEGKDGQEYLLGSGPRARGKTEGPFIKRRDGNQWTPLERERIASEMIREQLLGYPNSIGTHDEHVKQAVLCALSDFLDQFLKTARWGG